jgi:hypothetical protein
VSGNSGVVAGGNVDQSSRTSTVQGDQYTAQRDISVTRERRPKR